MPVGRRRESCRTPFCAADVFVPQTHFGVVDDRGEDVVELVRDRRGEHPRSSSFVTATTAGGVRRSQPGGARLPVRDAQGSPRSWLFLRSCSRSAAQSVSTGDDRPLANKSETIECLCVSRGACCTERPVVPILLFLRIGVVERTTEGDDRSKRNRFQRRLWWFLVCRA